MGSRRKSKSLRPASRATSSRPAPAARAASSRPAPRGTSSRPVPRSTSSSVRRQRDLVADVARALANVESVAGTLARVARVCVPELADMCIVDVMREGGRVERVEAVHADPSKAESMRQMRGQFAPRQEHPVMGVFASGRPLLVRDVDDAVLARIARDPAHLAILRRFGPKSQMRLPIVLGDRTVAVMTFAITDSPRRLSAQDLAFAEEIVARIVAALERAAAR
jgi:GAF domain-containing protein